jgi:hypothetical protein
MPLVIRRIDRADKVWLLRLVNNRAEHGSHV